MAQHGIGFMQAGHFGVELLKGDSHLIRQLLNIAFIMGQELVQRWVQGSDSHRPTAHDAEEALKVLLLHGQEGSQRPLPTLMILGENHLPHGVDAVAFKKHMLRSGQPDSFRTKGNGFFGLVRLVGIGPDLQAPEFIGPAEQRDIVLVDLRALGGKALVDEHPQNFRRPGRDLPRKDFSCRTIQGKVLSLTNNAVADGHAAASIIDLECPTADDTDLPHLAGYQGRVRGHSSPGSEDPAGSVHATNIIGRGFQPNQNDNLPALGPFFSIRRVEDDPPRGRTRTGCQPSSQHGTVSFCFLFGFWGKSRAQQLIHLIRVNPQESLFLADNAFPHHVDGGLEGGKSGALSGAGLEHPQLPSLDGEFNVLHVAIVAIQLGANALELAIDFRHLLFQGYFVAVTLLVLVDGFRGPDAGHHILTLGIHQILPVKDIFSRCRVTGEGHAGPAVFSHVAEHHGLDVDRGAHMLRNIVQLPVGNGAGIVPGAKDGRYRPPQLVHGVLAKFQVFALPNECFVALHKLLQIAGAELIVEFYATLLAHLLKNHIEGIMLILGFRFEPQHYVPVHVHKSAVAVVGKPFVPRLPDDSLDR